MPHTTLFEPGEFFPGIAARAPLVTENFARALFEVVEGEADVRGAATALAERIFEAHRETIARAPHFPAATPERDGTAGDEAIWLLIAVSPQEPHRAIFGIFSDASPQP